MGEGKLSTSVTWSRLHWFSFEEFEKSRFAMGVACKTATKVSSGATIARSPSDSPK